MDQSGEFPLRASTFHDFNEISVTWVFGNSRAQCIHFRCITLQNLHELAPFVQQHSRNPQAFVVRAGLSEKVQQFIASEWLDARLE
jgi:hypothetical protein